MCCANLLDDTQIGLTLKPLLLPRAGEVRAARGPVALCCKCSGLFVAHGVRPLGATTAEIEGATDQDWQAEAQSGVQPAEPDTRLPVACLVLAP